ncbi:MAG: T9SS type A sorting domain-containing protein [Flavobacteriales bacterium]|nr:T9SS type A sorting domain-containing protein [Flavobacteriales bacterium]
MRNFYITTAFIALLSLFQSNILFSQNEIIVTVPYQSVPDIGVHTTAPNGHTNIDEILQQCENFRNPKRIISINSSTGQLTFTRVGGWHQGAWFRGPQSFESANNWLNNYTGSYTSCQNGGFKVGLNQFAGCRPKYRDTAKQIRGMIQLYNRYNTFLYTNDKSTVVNMIKSGLDFLIYGQNSDGTYNNWDYRPDKWIPNYVGEIPSYHNETHLYEAAYALAAMCDGYMFYSKNSNLTYAQMTNLFNAINTTANRLLYEPINCIDNSNFRGLLAWSLSKAYKVTQDCNYLEKAKYHSSYLIDLQEDGGVCEGMWQTGGSEGNHEHDTRIWYHSIILRGLIETFDVTPNTATTFKNRLANSIKRGVNHVINYRINLNPSTSTQGATLAYWFDSNCLTNGTVDYLYHYSQDIVEPFALIAYYSKYHTEYFNSTEQTYLKNLLNWISLETESASKVGINGQSGEDAAKKAPSLLFYTSYNDAINTSQKVFNEDGINNRMNYNANMVSNRVVSGDFDNDGKKDDIAAFYDYGGTGSNAETRIHVWTGDFELFDYQSASGWWSAIGYEANKISGRVVSGDFDNDGYEDDIAAFYDYGNNETRIHMFIGNNGTFTYSGAMGWWNITGYNANAITGRVVVGDFYDGDGFKDDIAVFYDYGNNETRIHMFEGRSNYFSYASNYGWWNTTGYNANAITNRVVSGDFDNDFKHDDIAVFYDYGNGETRIHMFLGQNSWFYYPSNYGWWNTTGYNANAITNRVVSGDFDNDMLVDDIAVFYDYGNTETRMHVFEGRGNYFSYPSNYGLWNVSSGYNANSITGRVLSGDFFTSGSKGIAAIYDVGSNETRIHTWKLKTNPWQMEYFGAGGNWIQCMPNDYGNAYRETGISNFINESIEDKINLEESRDIIIHPNPTNGIFKVSIPNVREDVSIELYNLSGKLIARKKSNSEIIVIDISKYPNGIYLLKIQGNKFNKFSKLIKQ